MAFHELVARQAGRFTRGQASRAGFSSYQIAKRLKSGEWEAVQGRLLAVTASPHTPEAREWEALLVAGPGAVLAGPSAARRHGMEVPLAGPCVAVRPGRVVRLPSVRVLRAQLPDSDVFLVGDVLLTGRPRTVVDCMLLVDKPAGIRFAERALQRGWITFDDLALRAQASAGRHGVGRLVAAVRALGSGARSDTERRLVAGLRRRGVRDWQANLAVSDSSGPIGIIDLAFAGVKLAVELDGRAWHVDRDRFQSDRTKQNRLVAAGWTVLRFTWEDVAYRLEEVLDAIVVALARLSHARRVS